jgi:hypothetical protein
MLQRTLAGAALAVLLLVGVQPVLAQQDSGTTIRLASDTTWTAFSMASDTFSSVPLGHAQFVCLNAFAPSPCPDGATLYGSPATASQSWTADLSSIPGAHWIWAPGITSDTSPAELQQFLFTKSFDLATAPTAASISVAADDFAEVRVNGHVVGTNGSITDVSVAGRAQNTLVTFDLRSLLSAGQNTIAIRGRNGPASFSGGCSAHCTYAATPAAVVFGGSIAE